MVSLKKYFVLVTMLLSVMVKGQTVATDDPIAAMLDSLLSQKMFETAFSKPVFPKNNKYNRTVNIKTVDIVKGDYNPDKIIKILNLKNFTHFNYKNITDLSQLNDSTLNIFYQRNFIEYVNNLDNIFDILEHYNKEFDKLYQNNNNKHKLQYSYKKEIYLTDTSNIMCENKFTKLREDIIKFKEK